MYIYSYNGLSIRPMPGSCVLLCVPFLYKGWVISREDQLYYNYAGGEGRGLYPRILSQVRPSPAEPGCAV